MQKAWSRNRMGYLRVRISGYSTERFLNLCSANEMDIWELSPEQDAVVCSMTVPVFRRLKPLVRKSGVKVRILGRYGVPFFIAGNRKRQGLFAGGAAFFLILYILSLFVWNITFEGNSRYSRDTLLDYLDTLGVRYGMRKSGISCEDLEESIRSAFPEITWVSASVSGTRLFVRVKENEALSAIPEQDDSPRDLVAGRAGTVTRMVVRRGRAAVSAGDQVEKGQLLISSELSVTDDSGQVVRTMYVRGDGDVYARTRYTYRKILPVIREAKSFTGRKRYGFFLQAGPFRIRLLTPSSGKGSWDYLSESRQLCLFQDFYLPVYGAWIVGEEYELYGKFCTEMEAKALSEPIHSQYLENLMEKGVHIIENDVKIHRDGLSFIVEGTADCEEEITEARTVEVPPGKE